MNYSSMIDDLIDSLKSITYEVNNNYVERNTGNLFSKWIDTNNVQDIEFEEIKTINNDERTTMEVSVPANDIKYIGYDVSKK